MATVNPVAGSALFSAPVLQLLLALVGGTQDTDTTQNRTATGTEALNTAVTGTQNQTTNQAQNQQQTGRVTGTQNQATSQQQTARTTGTSTANTNQTTSTTSQNAVQNTADVGNLNAILAQQMQGITPEALAAIFQEGSRAAPGLISATSNAVGARASNNDPMATALTELSSRLVSQAALLDMQQRNQAAQTAAEIARLTSGQTTTGSQQATTTGTTTTDSTQDTTSNVTGTSTTNSVQDTLTNLINTLTGTTATNTAQNTTANRTTGENVNQTGNVQQDTQLNTGNLSTLLGALAGGSLLNSVLPGGIEGTATTAVNGITQLLAPLFQAIGLGSGPGLTVDPNGMGMDQIGAASPALRDLLTYMERGAQPPEGSEAANLMNDFWSSIGLGGTDLGMDAWANPDTTDWFNPVTDPADPSFWTWGETP